MKKKILALLLTGVMAVSVFAGCGGGDSSSSTSEGSSAADDAATAEDSSSGSTEGDTQVLNIRTTSFGNNYDVQDMGWRWMMAACYSGLYRNVADEEGEHFVLDGAESVDVSEDGTVYTFHLRQDAKWSDGEPVTAHDYEYGWKRLLDPQYGYDYASFVFNIVGAEEYNSGSGSVDDVKAVALDDYTFEVTLKQADPTFEAKLVSTPLYPTREDIAEAAGDQWGKDWTLCVYNGPFCMTGLVEDNQMTWTKNEYYWDAENTHLDTINWYLVAEDSTAATMFDNGELDVLQTSGDYSRKYQSEAEAGNIQMITADYPGTVYLAFDHANGGSSGLMGNVKIRKALAYSINREEMIEAVYGRYVPAYGFISPAITLDGESYREQVDEPMLAEYNEYAGDNEALQALFQEGLQELGMDTDLSKVTVTYLSYGSTVEDDAFREYLQQTWQQNLGITVELNTVGDYSLFTAERDAGNFDVYYGGWYSDYNDPLDYLATMKTGDFPSVSGNYSSEEYDSLIDSLSGEGDNAKRLEIYSQAEQVLFDDCALIPLYYSTKEYFVQNWVKDFRWSSFGASQEFYITYIEGRGN
ncbi:MAG TPA: peptide ABC transporter substrate-binding protein [Candidatus Pullilachnospira stercoravium]|uniref:Peptide ABC transporter substrate-binding protein n=1 Tax=Candidatus Pullilachnospira stercoravium TaxID=2840913 RepID=A0A9D1NVJ1_9FIRM|nr:peptide ABC transporter substrate-binding protein [Candidatus Pullilachnospira stercoravium]